MASGTWTTTATSVAWATATNWSSSVIADGAGFEANFQVSLGAAQTIDATIGGGWSGTIGSLRLLDTTSTWYGQTFNSGTITLDNGVSAPTIELYGTTGGSASVGAAIFNSAALAGTNGFTVYPTSAATGSPCIHYLIVLSASAGLSGTILVQPQTVDRSTRLQIGPGALSGITGITLDGRSSTPTAGVDLINGSAGGTNTFSKPVTTTGTATNTFIEAMGSDVVITSDNSGFTGNTRIFVRGTSPASISGTSASWYSTAPVLSFSAANNLGSSSSGEIHFYAEQANTAGWALKYTGSAATTVSRTIDIRPTGGSSGATSSTLAAQLYADGSGSITYSGAIKSTTGVGYLTLRGTGTGNNEISGVIQSTGGVVHLAKADAGKWILSAANLFTAGAITISGGTLNLRNSNALNGSTNTGVLSVASGATLELEGGISITRAGQSSAVTLAGTGVGSAGAIRAAGSSGSNTFIPPSTGISLTASISVGADAGTSLDITAAGAITGSGFGITKVGAGTVRLSGQANNYTGASSVSDGVLEVAKLANAGANSSLGAPAAGANAVIPVTGTLRFVGTNADSTSRSITFTSTAPSIEGSGTQPVTFSAATQAAGSRTITFGGTNTGNNTFSAALGDGSGGVTSIAKTGVGKWVLSGAPTFTGTLSVAAGTLDFNAVVYTLTGALSVSGGTLQNATFTIPNTGNTISGGTITANLAGSGKTITVSGSATLAPASGSNSFTNGTLNITSGTLELTTESESGGKPAQVVGSMAVNVSAGAGIRTTTGTVQRGRMRFGGAVTFNGTSGSPCKFYIGT